eukprot:1161115-Pelagomonas_calceolata.AAC.1
MRHCASPSPGYAVVCAPENAPENAAACLPVCRWKHGGVASEYAAVCAPENAPENAAAYGIMASECAVACAPENAPEHAAAYLPVCRWKHGGVASEMRQCVSPSPEYAVVCAPENAPEHAAKVVGLERMTSTQCTCSLYHVLPFLNGDRLVCFEEITNLEIDTIAFLQSSAMARLSSERGALEETNTQLQDLIDQGNSEKQVLEQRLAQVCV